MTRSSGSGGKVWWAELLPWEFKQRLAECPVAYLPLGLCEPHGQIAALGLDTIKAEWLCEQAARQAGGIVAPTMGYHIHESGYHARWLEDTVGEHNPHMTGMPPHVYLHFFLYQLRALVHAGFKAIFVISGHSGGNQFDLRRAAAAFTRLSSVPVYVASDPELVTGQYEGDHAGKYEISQLMYLRPELVDLARDHLHDIDEAGGALAIGDNAREASAELGEHIMQACLRQLIQEVERVPLGQDKPARSMMTYEMIEGLWQQLWQERADWVTSQPHEDQLPVTPGSQWKQAERALHQLFGSGER
ncbi:creatininase family protein [Paenibacillus sp. GCM10023252]|uniref:creatininase family protein n=1 Tax=Paenibacillus sp. GCM10023252 TaxID=3252649 RepID=UPI003610E6E2